MGDYTNQDGQSISYTDGETLRDVADLWAVVKGDYNGTPSSESESLKEMLGDLQAGKPLTDIEWSMFHRFKRKYAAQLARFRASPDNEAEGFVPVPSAGTGRINEVMATLPPSLRSRIRENSPGSKPTIAVDFDGVIHTYAGWNEGKVEGEPMSGAAAGLATLHQAYRVVVFTARTDLAVVRHWLLDKGLAKYVDDVTNNKPPARYYIDDRAIHFTDWPTIIRTIAQPMQESQPKPPPGLRMADKEGEECGMCEMFNHGLCSGYSNLPVSPKWWCKSFSLAPDWEVQSANTELDPMMLVYLVGKGR